MICEISELHKFEVVMLSGRLLSGSGRVGLFNLGLGSGSGQPDFTFRANFIIFSTYLDDVVGQIFALFILTVAAAESSIGLAILVIYYRLKGVISINVINYIKG